jgi:dTMP kinase
MSLKKGILIVIEGIDGAGKSTQARLLVRRLKARGFDAVSYREPTRGKWGREIKRLARRSDSLSPEEELALFVRDREENVRKNLKPALSRRKIVILDRYYFSTMAYQGARGIDPARIRRINERFAVKPDLIFILDIEAGKGLGRIRHRKRKDLLFERKKYLARVRKIFRGLRGRKFVHLDASRPRLEVSRDIAARVLRLVRRRQR